jgi:hypothetical protein
MTIAKGKPPVIAAGGRVHRGLPTSLCQPLLEASGGISAVYTVTHTPTPIIHLLILNIVNPPLFSVSEWALARMLHFFSLAQLCNSKPATLLTAYQILGASAVMSILPKQQVKENRDPRKPEARVRV